MRTETAREGILSVRKKRHTNTVPKQTGNHNEHNSGNEEDNKNKRQRTHTQTHTQRERERCE